MMSPVSKRPSHYFKNEVRLTHKTGWACIEQAVDRDNNIQYLEQNLFLGEELILVEKLEMSAENTGELCQFFVDGHTQQSIVYLLASQKGQGRS